MYLSVHATAGVLIGSYAANSPVAFLVGVASHFLLDMLPHRDGMEPESNLSIRQVRQRYFDKIVGIIYLDVCLSIVVAGALLQQHSLCHPCYHLGYFRRRAARPAASLCIPAAENWLAEAVPGAA